MSNVRGRMTSRTTVERDSSGSTSTIGAKNIPDWQPLHEDQPCFMVGLLFQRQGREVVNPNEAVGLSEFGVLLPLGLDVTHLDRLNGIRDRLGNDIVTGIINIRTILPHHNHLELKCERAN